MLRPCASSGGAGAWPREEAAIINDLSFIVVKAGRHPTPSRCELEHRLRFWSGPHVGRPLQSGGGLLGKISGSWVFVDGASHGVKRVMYALPWARATHVVVCERTAGEPDGRGEHRGGSGSTARVMGRRFGRRSKLDGGRVKLQEFATRTESLTPGRSGDLWS